MFHECRTPEQCEGVNDDGLVEPDSSSSLLGMGSETSLEEDEEEPIELRTYGDDSSLRDQQSTGRKRAARAYPMDPTSPCEWSGKKNCGGGEFPIVGCLGNLQQARHHGPDKNTLNNERGNVHRICHTCHNRWHTLNDETYIWNSVYNPHSPVVADPVEIGFNEEWWKGKKVARARD